LVREGYKNADTLLAHAAEVGPELFELLSISGEACHIDIFGPEAEIEKLKEPLKEMNIPNLRYFTLDDHSRTFFKTAYEAALTDNHVTIAPYFTIPDGKMDEFQELFAPFAERVKAGTGCGSGECLYHGFVIHENTVFCREGYRNAQGALHHLKEAKDLLAKAREIVGKDGMEISVIAPKSEMEVLRARLEPTGAKFYELEERAICTYQ